MAQPSNNIIDISDVKRIWNLFAHYWYIYLIFLLIAGGIGYLYIHQSTQIYKAKITVLLQSEEESNIRQSVIGGLRGQYAYSSYMSSKKQLQNEKRVIKSHNLINEALDRLNFKVSYFLIGRLRTTPQYQTTPFTVELQKNGVSYSGPYLVQLIDKNKYRLIIEAEDKAYNKVHKFNKPIKTDYFHFTVQKNHRLENLIEKQDVSLSDVEYKFKINSRSHLIRQYKSALKIESEEYSDILDITCTDIIPERAQDFLDTLTAVYQEHSLKRRKTINQKTLSFIDQQLNQVATNLNQIEKELQGYKSRNFMLNLDQAQDAYFSQLLNYETQKVELRMQDKLIEYLYNYIKKNKQGFDFSPALLKQENYPYIKDYFNELRKLQQEKKKALSKTTGKSFRVQQLNRQIEDLKSQILKHLENIQKSIPLNIEALNAQIAEYKKQIQKIPQAERKLVNIKRKLKVNEEIYLYLLEKKAETVISKGGIVSEKSVIENARSLGIVKPNQQRIMVSALGLGFILALLSVFVNELFFKKISSKEELEDLSDIPVLGEVGRLSADQREYLAAAEHPKTPIAEAFRSIRTNLDYFGMELKKRTILVTSSFEQEGKTFCATNTAVMLAKAQRKVLLLDLDLHRPAVHKVFQANNQSGITTYLVGKAKQKDIIQSSKYDHLDVVFGGPIPPNPSELLLSKKFKRFLKRVKKKYDDIVIDTPPTGPITDALVLMKEADITLYVVRAHKANRDYVKQANEIKEKHRPSNLAFILNSVKGHRQSYKYYYY